MNSFPSMACDISTGPNSGNLYVVWSNVGVPGTNTGTNISVYMARSTNGGTNWSTPIRVNQNPYTEGKESYFPWICCDPETGVLAAVFYDDRNTTSSSCETFSAYSADAGVTWFDFLVSDVSFTPSPIPGLASSYMEIIWVLQPGEEKFIPAGRIPGVEFL
ncbi:MAG: sialidase family protein [Bacteroidales bacterium]